MEGGSINLRIFQLVYMVVKLGKIEYDRQEWKKIVGRAR